MKRMKQKILSLLLVACMVLGMLPISAVAAGEFSIDMGKPTVVAKGVSYKLSELTVASTENIKNLLVSVDSGSFAAPAATELAENVQELSTLAGGAGMTKTYIIPDGTTAARAQAFLRGITFALKDGATQNVTITADKNTTNIPVGMTLSTLTVGGKPHYYGFVQGATSDSWGQAYNAAKTWRLMGMQGYLVTITEAAEDTVLDNLSKLGGWSGGTAEIPSANTQFADPDTLTTNGVTANYFYWACGPEAGTKYWNARVEVGGKITGVYSNWSDIQPDNASNIESCMSIHYTSDVAEGPRWNDINRANVGGQPYASQGYFVEFGGYDADPGQPDANKTATVGKPVTKLDLTPIPLTDSLSGIAVTGGVPATVTAGSAVEFDLTPSKGFYLPSAVTITNGADTITAPYTRESGTKATLKFTAPDTEKEKNDVLGNKIVGLLLSGAAFQPPKPRLTVQKAGTVYTLSVTESTSAIGTGNPVTDIKLEYKEGADETWKAYTLPIVVDGSADAGKYRFRQSGTIDGLVGLASDEVAPVVGYQPTRLINGSFENWPQTMGPLRFYEWRKADPAYFGWRSSFEDQIELAVGSSGGYGVEGAADGNAFTELNLSYPTVLYQIIATEPGEVIDWSLAHRGRGGLDTMNLYFFGVPNYNDLPKKATNVDQLVGMTPQAVCASPAGKWSEYKGTYVVPEGQTLTCFAFKSVSAAMGDVGGNLLDNIVFTTMLSKLTVTVKDENPHVADVEAYCAKPGSTVNYNIYRAADKAFATSLATGTFQTGSAVGTFTAQIDLTGIPAGQYVVKAYIGNDPKMSASGSFTKKSPTVSVDVDSTGDVTITVVPQLGADKNKSTVYAKDPTADPTVAALTVDGNGKITNLPNPFTPEAPGGPYLYVKEKETTATDVVTRTAYTSTGVAHKSSKTGIAVSGSTTLSGTNLSTPLIAGDALKLAPIHAGKVEQKSGANWISAVPVYAPKAMTFTATAGQGAYFFGVEINGTLCKTLDEVRIALADTAAALTLATNGVGQNTLAFSASGQQHLYAVYCNLLGEINAAKGAIAMKALLDDEHLVPVFKSSDSVNIAAMNTAYKTLHRVNQAKAAELLGSMRPKTGYTYPEFIAAYNSALGLMTLIGEAGILNESDYTSGTWSVLVTAKKAADTIINGAAEPISMQAVADAEIALRAAIAGLQWKTLTLLIKAPEAMLTKIVVTPKAKIRAAVINTVPGSESLSTASYFPVIGTSVTIAVDKADYAGMTMTAVMADGKALHFNDDGTTMVAVVGPLTVSNTVIFTFADNTVNLTLPSVPGLSISTDGGRTDESGETLSKQAGRDIVLTLQPGEDKILVPGAKITVTIGGVQSEYPLADDGTVKIPGKDVTGDVVVNPGSLAGAINSVTKGTIEVLLKDLKDKYKDILTDYTPTTMDALQKAIAQVEVALEKTIPDIKELEALYKAALAAEGKLVRQFPVTIPTGLTPKPSGTAPDGWNPDVYADATKAQYVAPGVTKVTKGTETIYFVENGMDITLDGTTTKGDFVKSATYKQGNIAGKSAIVQNGAEEAYTVTLLNITAPVTDIAVSTENKVITINPDDLTPPATVRPGAPGTAVIDPAPGSKVTEVTVDKGPVTMPDDALLEAIREAIKGETTDGTVTIHYPNPTDNLDIVVDVEHPDATHTTGTVTLPDGRELTVTVDKGQTPVVTNEIVITGKHDDVFEDIAIDPETGDVTVKFPDTDTGTHTVGGKTALITHAVTITGADVAPTATITGTTNKPAMANVPEMNYAESHDVLITLTPAEGTKLLPGGKITYVVTNPVSGSTKTYEIDPADPKHTNGTVTADPATGVITITVPKENTNGAITLPEDKLKASIATEDLARLKELAKIAEELLAQKDEGTFAPTNDQWNAIDKTVAQSPAKVADEIIKGNDKITDIKEAITNLEAAIKAVTDTRTMVSVIPNPNPTPGTGITTPAATITTPDAGGAGDTDGKLTMPMDNLVITPIKTDPGYVPDKVIITVTDPVTGEKTEIEIPLVPGGNLTGDNPYTATIPPDQIVKPSDKTLEETLNDLKPGVITGIEVVGKRSGTTMPTVIAIMAAGNTKTGHPNGVGSKSAAISAIVVTPESEPVVGDTVVTVVPEGKSVSIAATLGKDDYSQTGIVGAVNYPYAFVGVKVNGVLLTAPADYTVRTQNGVATVTFSATQLEKFGGEMRSIELITKPTNPQYITFVNDYAGLAGLYEAYAKPNATTKEKAAFEERVQNLHRQFSDDLQISPAIRLTADNRSHLVDEKAQLQAYVDAIDAKQKGSKTADAIDEMYAALNKDTTAAGDPMPVNDPITRTVANAVLGHETAINTVKDAFDKLSPAERNEVSADSQRKLQEAVDALEKAKQSGGSKEDMIADLISKLPADILINPAKPAEGLKDQVNHSNDVGKNAYGINENGTASDAVNKAGLIKLGELDRQLETIEKLSAGQNITLKQKKQLDDLRVAINKEYADYALLFVTEHLTDNDQIAPAIPGVWPADKIVDWGKYPDELIDAKSEFDKLPEKVQDLVDGLTGQPTIDDLAKTEFPDVVRPTGVTAESILAELNKATVQAPDYILVADLAKPGVVAPSNKTGPQWIESIVKTYEKFQKLSAEEQGKVNAALSEGNKMEDLYNYAKDKTPTSPESQSAADKFIRDHLMENGKIIKTATQANKNQIIGGEAEWNALTPGAQQAVNDKLTATGGKTYPVLLADAKALGGNTGGGGGGGSTGGGGATITSPEGGTVTVTPQNPKPGDTVTITVKPDEGYALDNLVIKTTPGGQNVPYTDNGDHTYTYIQPAQQVIITATFRKLAADPADTGVSRLLNTTEHMAYLIGGSHGNFRPDANMTRAEVAVLFSRLLKEQGKNGGTKTKFTDVAEGMWYTEAIRELTDLGILTGYEDGSFRPNQPVARAEFTAIAMRFAIAATGEKTFTDVPTTHWAYGYISGAARYGWINGYTDGSFRPSAKITRAEAVKMTNAMLYRMADRKMIHSVTTILQFTDVPVRHWAYYEIAEATNAHSHSMIAGAEVWGTMAG